MDKDNYDPKTFFALHDLNADGFWNEQEIEALFQAELEKVEFTIEFTNQTTQIHNSSFYFHKFKVYNETNPDDDPKEKY